jgi:hypothetical protein
MKYLLILLFLFSTHSFSGEVDGKFLTCISTKSNEDAQYEHDKEWELFVF